MSLMTAHYRNDFVGVDAVNGNGAGYSMGSETPKRSPRILITRACSEDSQEGGSPLLRRNYGGATTIPPCESKSRSFSK